MNRAAGQTIFLLTLVAGAAAISYWGVREKRSPAISTAPTAMAPAANTVSIAMPHEEPLPPLGPHRSTFQTACTVCHSTRLALNQPPFAAERWQQIVEKMIRVYGAQVSAVEQKEIVAYLAAISARKAQARPSDGEAAAIGSTE